MAACGSCGEPIVWVKSSNGKPMPLDQRKVLGGNIEIVHGVAHVRPSHSEALMYVSHFVTCPNANEHRSR